MQITGSSSSATQKRMQCLLLYLLEQASLQEICFSTWVMLSFFLPELFLPRKHERHKKGNYNFPKDSIDHRLFGSSSYRRLLSRHFRMLITNANIVICELFQPSFPRQNYLLLLISYNYSGLHAKYVHEQIYTVHTLLTFPSL